MRDPADRPARSRRRASASDIAGYVLTAGAVLLGWQMAIQPLMQRAPVEFAIRVAPGSPMVLSRAAEAELAAGRIDNAAVLGRDSLVRSPFDVRALRTLGLTEARAGRQTAADEILTLAGNWSLRDDPAHAWLVERRLRRGDYASAFAHADTLVRRRQDIQPQVFRLFTLAGTADPQRSLPVIAKLLAAGPPWRRAYLDSLDQSPEQLGLEASLAIMLEAGSAPLTNDELQSLYGSLLGKQQFELLNTVRAQIKRPAAGAAITNGDFADMTAPAPFQWQLYEEAGISAEIVADDLRPSNPALRVDYNGYAAGVIASQLTSLGPGSYRFSTDVRLESGSPTARLTWTLACTTGDAIMSLPVELPAAAPGAWTGLPGRFEIPSGCPAQWLRLVTRADDRRSPTVVWFDRIAISPAD